MTIDFHTHIFPAKIAARTIEKLEDTAHVKAFTDGREESLIRSMEEAGGDLSIVLPVVTKPGQFATVNQFAQKMNQKYEGKDTRLLSFGGIHPDSPDYKGELRAIRDMGLLGIKLHPDYQDTYIDDIKYMRILDYASELGLVQVVHAGVDIGFPDNVRCTVGGVCRVLEQVHPKKMVLAHYGGFGLWGEVEEALAGQDVYFDTAYTFGFIKDDDFLRILKKHGPEKILFATDSPWSGQKESLAHLRSMGLGQEAADLIMGKNAGRLLGEA